MNWQKGVAEALQKNKCFCQGNYCVSSHDASKVGWCSDVFYYGYRVFCYSHHPSIHEDSYEYDFCGYEGHSRTTKIINCCLEAVGAKYRVKIVKGKVVEVPVTEKTAKYNGK